MLNYRGIKAVAGIVLYLAAMVFTQATPDTVVISGQNTNKNSNIKFNENLKVRRFVDPERRSIKQFVSTRSKNLDVITITDPTPGGSASPLYEAKNKVSDSRIVREIEVKITIKYTFLFWLGIELVSPQGRVYRLKSSNLGDYVGTREGVSFLTFTSDQKKAGALPPVNKSPVTGTFLSESSLIDQSVSANGEWILRVIDEMPSLTSQDVLTGEVTTTARPVIQSYTIILKVDKVSKPGYRF